MAPSATSPDPISPSKTDPALPLISLAPLLSPSSSTLPTAHSLLSALTNSGFLYLTDSPIPPSLLSRVYALSARFFARPTHEKDALAWTTARSNRGYTSLGQEKTSLGVSKEEVAQEREGQGQDQKESFEIGRDDEEGCPNRWPEGDEEFREVMMEFFARCKELHAVAMRGIALGMGLEGEFFADFVKNGDNTLRLLHYPGVAADAFAGGRVRAGLHSDYGSITLLFQDERGGLQVERPDGSFVDVAPIEGTVVMNAGDLLTRWSNGLIRSTRHRVVEPPLKKGQGQDGRYPPRYSVAYFCNPDFDKTIEALPGTWEDEKGGKKWEPVNSGEYLWQRLSATY
ncbi:MAG: hypothetical protein LQ346_006160 [Caloplaca aetnensis]|nr:MAG: hypothetical protein LQ346_006160 [Caloplaca aetnensis]